MKKIFLFLTLAALGICSAQAEVKGYERRAFEGRYALWGGVHCMADSVRVSADGDDWLLARYPVLQMEADAKSELSRLGFPGFCEASATPAPATMVAVVLEIRAEVGANGSLAYFVRLLANMPDGDFARKNFGQFTTWESDGKLGHTDGEHFRESIRVAMAEQIDGFARFMSRTRRIRDQSIRR